MILPKQSTHNHTINLSNRLDHYLYVLSRKSLFFSLSFLFSYLWFFFFEIRRISSAISIKKMRALQRDYQLPGRQKSYHNYQHTSMELINSRKESTVITEEWFTQLKRLIKQLALREEMGVGMPSKHLLFLSIHKHHKSTSGNQKPDLFDGRPYFPGTPTHKSLSQSVWHGPSHTKERKEHVPKICGNNATKKQVSGRFWVA